MLARVEPHDLTAICIAFGTTLEVLSEETGLTQEQLLAFAAGRIGLSAEDRWRILESLDKHATQDAQLTQRLRTPDCVSRALIMGVGTRQISEGAYNHIMQEIDEERQIANRKH